MPFVNILSRVNSPPFAIFSLFYCFFALFPLFTVFSVILNVCSRGHSEPPCGVKNPIGITFSPVGFFAVLRMTHKKRPSPLLSSF